MAQLGSFTTDPRHGCWGTLVGSPRAGIFPGCAAVTLTDAVPCIRPGIPEFHAT